MYKGSDLRLVLSNCPDAETARAIGRALVERELVACVSVLAPCQSFYRWQGRICDDIEVPVLIKTTAARYPEVEALICELHPYEVPEIIALDIAAGLPAYLDWVRQCAPPNNPPTS